MNEYVSVTVWKHSDPIDWALWIQLIKPSSCWRYFSLNGK